MSEIDSNTAATPPALLEHDVACIRCDYNLRTQAPGGVCPECGTPIADALRADLLRFADQRWVKCLRRGASLLLIGSAVFVVTYGMMLLPFVWGFRVGLSVNVMELFFFGGAFAMVVGAGLLTVREPAPQCATNRTTWVRPAARWLLASSLVALLLLWLGLSFPVSVFFRAARTLAVVALVLGVNLLLVHLRVLARRGPVPRLVLRLTVLVWTMAGLTGLTIINALIDLWWQTLYPDLYFRWDNLFGDFEVVVVWIGIAVMVVVVAVGTVVVTVLLRGMLDGELKRHPDVPRIFLVASESKVVVHFDATSDPPD